MTRKNSCGSKIPLPPYNFSNGPSLILVRAGEFRNTRLPPAVNKYPSPFDVELRSALEFFLKNWVFGAVFLL